MVIFLPFAVYRLGHGSTQSLIQLILGAVLLWVQHPSHETQLHQVLKAKKERSYTSTIKCPNGMVFKQRGILPNFFNFVRISNKIGNAHTMCHVQVTTVATAMNNVLTLVCVVKVMEYSARFCHTHMLPQNAVCQSSIFFYTHLIYMQKPTICFLILLHDTQDIRN